MQANSLFRMYSMTNPVTSTALLMLYEEGKFQLDDPRHSMDMAIQWNWYGSHDRLD
jgi:CubicO group peptidase (beta-lactamase class C family)